ncbi:hypothetical protein HJC23_003865 [Cyclotella cryptica]|uniref:Chloride channel protein n=1 Tax=Cyclotella cryptica TaxID=29204 RepID=A0ABD3NYA3_9STRA
MIVTVGSLIGASLARKFWNRRQCDNPNSSTTTPSIPSKSSLEKTLAYAGAAGSLTGFMNIPIAGPIFALEMTSRKAGFARSAVDSFSTAILASLAGIAFVRGIMLPHVGTGGHFHYVSRAAVGLVTGREMILVGLGCGLGGAMVGTSFHAAVRFLKGLIWSKKKDTRTENAKKCETYLGILKMTFVALMIGMLSTQYPQTMFWGEGSLQCMISGQCTPFAATPHGLPISMMQWAKVNPNIPFTSWFDAMQVGMAKFFAIALACAGMFPGGVIFPLLSNGAGLSRALIDGVTKLVPSVAHSIVSPMMVMSFMAATLTSITRTPLATCLILSLTASGITPLSVLLPGALLASYVSVFVSEKLSKESFFKYSN